MSVADQIAKLQSLRNDGALSDIEFETQKALILKGQSAGKPGISGRPEISNQSRALRVVLTFLIASFLLYLALGIVTTILSGGFRPEILLNSLRFGPVGPNYFAFSAIVFILFGEFWYGELIMGFSCLAVLYLIVGFQGKISADVKTATLMGVGAYAVFSCVFLPIFVYGSPLEMIPALIVSVVFLLIIHASLGAFSNRNLRG